MQDLEPHESDLRGSRGIFLVGALMTYMAVGNFKNTVITIRNKGKVKTRGPKGPGPSNATPAS